MNWPCTQGLRHWADICRPVGAQCRHRRRVSRGHLMNNIFPSISRRTALKSAASGFGYLAFAGLSTWAADAEKASTGAPDKPAAANPLAPKSPHFPAKANRVIFLCMEGGPSHVD